MPLEKRLYSFWDWKAEGCWRTCTG